MDRAESLRRLASHAPFDSFEPGELEQLLEACELKNAASGQAYLKEGGRGDSALLILEGRSEVTKIGSSGQSHRLDEVHPGDLLGEVGLLTEHPRSATVTALEAVVWLELPRDRFQSMLASGSSAARKLLEHVARTLADRARAMNERFVDLLEHEHASGGPPDFEDLRARLHRALVRP